MKSFFVYLWAVRRYFSDSLLDLLTCPECRKWLQEAIRLYRGDFLPNFYLPDSGEFEDWAQGRRELYRRRMLDALDNLAEIYLMGGEHRQAQTIAQRHLKINELDERAQRHLMEALARNGQRNEALAHYQRLRLLLQKELGVEPSEQTTALNNRIYAGELEILTGHVDIPTASHQPQHLPDTPNDFSAQPRPQEEQFLLHKVKTFWVEGVLEKSIHGEVLIELGKETRPQALEYPWEMVVQPAAQKPYTLAPDKSIAQVFQEANQSLLILGAPGSGKTTMLLELAKTLISTAEQDPLLPIPVIFNLSSWTGDKTLMAWLVDELSQKYLIPKKFSLPWLEDDKLLLLLDGLDEVDPKHQQSCVEANNAFRQDHLAGMVVCSRAADYEAITKKFKLESAIFLQPLTQEQVDAYLGSSDKGLEAVRSLLRKDTGFEELARTPLMLSIITLAYQGISVEELTTIVSTDERRQYLFATYVQQMFKRRGVSNLFSIDQTRQWLSWLANGMSENDSTIFFLELLQPSWLSTRFQRWAYLLVTRMLGGFFIGTILWLNLLIGRLVGWSFQQELAKRMSGILQVSESASVFIFPVVFSVALGLVVALFHIIVYERDKD